MSIMIFSVTSMTSNELERAAFEPYGRVERLFFYFIFFLLVWHTLLIEGTNWKVEEQVHSKLSCAEWIFKKETICLPRISEGSCVFRDTRLYYAAHK